MELDFLAARPNYWAHLRPVVEALTARGVTVRDARNNPTPDAFIRNAPILVAGIQDVVRAQRVGYRIALLEHGIGQTYDGDPSDLYEHPAFPGGRDRDAVNLFLSPNETAAARDRARYPTARVEIVGDPHLASLPARVPDGRTTVAFSFQWGSGPIPERRSALEHYRLAMARLRVELPDVTFIGHSHPRIDLSGIYRGLGWEYVRDFDEVCRRADLYVCDNSSTIYEFASTGRPVALLNAPWFRTPVEHGLRFWSEASIGVAVFNPDLLAYSISRALADDWPFNAESRALVLERVYGGWPERVGPDAAVEVLLEWLGVTVPA